MTETEEFEIQVKALHALSDIIQDAVRHAYETGWNDGCTFVRTPTHVGRRNADQIEAEPAKLSFLESWHEYEKRHR